VSGGLRWFLTFLGALAGGFIALAVYLGPNVLAFVFHEDRRTEPFVMVHLIELANPSDPSLPPAELAGAAFGVGKNQDGKLVWSARVDAIGEGTLQQRWTKLALVQYPSRAAYVDLVTGTDYRDAGDVRERWIARRAMLVGVGHTPRDADALTAPAAGVRYAARLLRFGSDRAEERYFAEWLKQDVAVVEEHHGTVAWEARLEPLVGEKDARYDHALIVSFPDGITLDEWWNDPQRATLQSLERRMMDGELVMLLTPEPVQGAS
jgi:hypothetical protein